MSQGTSRSKGWRSSRPRHDLEFVAIGTEHAVDELTVLALAAGRGDVVALAAFARSSYRDIWRFCAFLHPSGDADDLTQEVYLRAVRALPGFRGDCSARAWLFAIARRTMADSMRARARLLRSRRQPSPVVVSGDPAEQVAVFALLGDVDADQRAAFVLTQLVGLSYAEVAHVMRCPVGTVRSRVARARAHLVTVMTATEPIDEHPKQTTST